MTSLDGTIWEGVLMFCVAFGPCTLITIVVLQVLLLCRNKSLKKKIESLEQKL